MYQGTTPSIPIILEGINLTEARVYLTLFDEQKKKEHEFVSGTDFMTEFDGTNTVTYLTLTQELTLELGTGICSIQARWIFPDGVAGATQKTGVQIQGVLKKGVISFGGD